VLSSTRTPRLILDHHRDSGGDAQRFVDFNGLNLPQEVNWRLIPPAKMVGQTPNNSVWSAMSYVPPKGRCNFKTSLMSPACPCLRFMLHPVKVINGSDILAARAHTDPILTLLIGCDEFRLRRL